MVTGTVVTLTTSVETAGAGGVAGADMFTLGVRMMTVSGLTTAGVQVAQGHPGQAAATALLTFGGGYAEKKLVNSLGLTTEFAVAEGQSASQAAGNLVGGQILSVNTEFIYGGIGMVADKKAEDNTNSAQANKPADAAQGSSSQGTDPIATNPFMPAAPSDQNSGNGPVLAPTTNSSSAKAAPAKTAKAASSGNSSTSATPAAAPVGLAPEIPGAGGNNSGGNSNY